MDSKTAMILFIVQLIEGVQPGLLEVVIPSIKANNKESVTRTLGGCDLVNTTMKL